MKCFNHIQEDAVIQCENCSCGLCDSCAHEFDKTLCYSCNKKIWKEVIGDIKIRLGISIVIAVVIMIFVPTGFHNNNAQITLLQLIGVTVFAAYTGASLPYGWLKYKSWRESSRKDTVTVTVHDGGLLGILYYYVFKWIFKFYAVIFIGMFVSPYYLYQDIKKYRTANETINYIDGIIAKK